MPFHDGAEEGRRHKTHAHTPVRRKFNRRNPVYTICFSLCRISFARMPQSASLFDAIFLFPSRRDDYKDIFFPSFIRFVCSFVALRRAPLNAYDGTRQILFSSYYFVPPTATQQRPLLHLAFITDLTLYTPTDSLSPLHVSDLCTPAHSHLSLFLVLCENARTFAPLQFGGSV